MSSLAPSSQSPPCGCDDVVAFDVEVASLGRLENILRVAVHRNGEGEGDGYRIIRIALVKRLNDAATTDKNIVPLFVSHLINGCRDDKRENDDDEDKSDYDELPSSFTEIINPYARDLLKRCIRDRSRDASWLRSRILAYVDFADKQYDTIVQQMDSLRDVAVTITGESESDALDNNPRAILAVLLFLQWFHLMLVIPVDYQRDIMNFVSIPSRNSVRVCVCEHAFQRAIEEATTTTIDPDLQRMLQPTADNTAAAAAAAAAVVDVAAVVSKITPSPFTVSDGRVRLTPSCRDRVRNRAVDVIVRDSATDKSLDDDASDDDCSSSKRRKRRRNGDNDEMTTTRTTFPPTGTTTTTDEQKRVLDVLQRVFSTNTTNGAVAENPRVAETIHWEIVILGRQKTGTEIRQRQRQPPPPPQRRRVLVDGVAGAGKTFLLGILLQRFQRVRYLVKKRSFVEQTRRRFPNSDNLQAQTVDAYLMRHLGIKKLHVWLNQRKYELPLLLRRLDRRPVAADDDELIFVDEYSLIEESLAESLNRALVNRIVVLVGDCNQQPAIGDRENQPVLTVLGYENVCFMYENVRTNDARLLQRLQHFHSRVDDVRVRAILGLPAERDIDMSDFFRRDDDHPRRDFRLVPRVIVTSNDKVNYLNWCIGYLIRRNSIDAELHCLRYKRSIVVSRPVMRYLVTKWDRRKEWSDGRTEHLSFDDDPFADEQFVIVGLRYRIIFAKDKWPVQVGTRVIIKRIIDDDTVEVDTDDERSWDFVLRKMRIPPYEYSSRWQRLLESIDEECYRDGGGANRKRERDECGPHVLLYMFPFVMDAATTVYQVQGLTLNETIYPRCYVDVQGMDEKALYVSLSRFQREEQIRGIANCQTVKRG